MWREVLERFEEEAPVSVMARVVLEQALPAAWIDEVFEASRQRQYLRELLMSTVVELMMLVSLGLRPSLHAAAKKMRDLPVTLPARASSCASMRTTRVCCTKPPGRKRAAAIRECCMNRPLASMRPMEEPREYHGGASV